MLASVNSFFVSQWTSQTRHCSIPSVNFLRLLIYHCGLCRTQEPCVNATMSDLSSANLHDRIAALTLINNLLSQKLVKERTQRLSAEQSSVWLKTWIIRHLIPRPSWDLEPAMNLLPNRMHVWPNFSPRWKKRIPWFLSKMKLLRRKEAKSSYWRSKWFVAQFTACI